MKSYKTVTVELHPEEAINGAARDLRELGSELRSWCQRMAGTNFDQSQKYSLLDKAATILEGVQDIQHKPWPNAEAKIMTSYLTPKRNNRTPSRVVRLDNAIHQIGVVASFYNNLDDDYHDIIRQFVEMAESVSGLEIPSMYG